MRIKAAILSIVLAPPLAHAQPTRADYERALTMRERQQFTTSGVVDGVGWIGKTGRFQYRRTVAGGHEHIVMDRDTLEKRPAFDHARLAEALAKASGEKQEPLRLPTFTFGDDERTLEMTVDQTRYRCALSDYSCSRVESPLFPGAIRGVSGPVRGAEPPREVRPKPSPDGKWEALIDNYNVVVRAKGEKAERRLTGDGSEGSPYDLASLAWSPDSSKIAVYRIRPGYRRTVHYVESAPEDQLQPKHWTLQYAKPGDVLDLEQPVLIRLDGAKSIAIANTLFPNPYTLSALAWRKDSRAFSFDYNQRGHQAYRVIEVDAATGAARAVISEEPKTFFYYGLAASNRQSGKRFRYDVADGKEVVWMSERDDWNHLYLYDGASGRLKGQITRGDWAVRGVEKVDEEKRQIWFSATGTRTGEDPYFLHYFRIGFDGSGLTKLTEAPADHELKFSSDMRHFVDTYSRVDLPTVAELRKADDLSLVAAVEKADVSELQKAGWKAPEPFVAKGRDGTTDIWGLIFRPSRFDPKKKYPVIENIYAGPHGSHVPKSWSPYLASQAQAELGFIVVQIDGMGTSNRSKAFHDVAWQNLGDAGFPDRILWHKAAAKKYPYYDATRVGIYGGSAGGQNAMGALLFHPEFYKVAVAYAGCHDNRMDKIWWNEQWMGWPIGPQYAAASNVDNAAKLQGKLLLVVGELDTNVDPASTFQVVHALMDANKTFDFLVVPGANHNAARGGAYASYGDRKRYDFFAKHLLGVDPPDWNKDAPAGTN